MDQLPLAAVSFAIGAFILWSQYHSTVELTVSRVGKSELAPESIPPRSWNMPVEDLSVAHLCAIDQSGSTRVGL